MTTEPQTEPQPEDQRTPIDVTALIGPIAAAKWTCPNCGATAISVAEQAVAALSHGQVIGIECKCGALLRLRISMIQRVQDKAVVRRAPVSLR